MAGMDTNDPRERIPASEFATTQWSIVLGAGRAKQNDARGALAALCQTYWFPLYAYVRRRVKDASEAQDLTQEFFARLIERDIVASAAPERGRFRSFLLTAMKNFLTNEWNRGHAQKRGGQRPALSLDFDAGDSRLGIEPGHELTPDRLFERKWAMTLLDVVLSRLRTEYAASGKTTQFDLLRHFIGGNRSESSYADVARELEISESAAKTAAHRLRRRYRDLLREELAQTVADPADVDDEISWLFKAIG
jgi:RNA polymerase sigma-70 factor (ECF subfamily)